MTVPPTKTLCILLVFFLLCKFEPPALAVRKPGDALVYESSEQGKLEGGHLPGPAYAAQPALHRTITMAVTSVAADGTAQVHVTAHKEAMDSFSAVQRQAWEKLATGQFDAALTPEGALLIAPEASVQPGDQISPTGMSLREYGNRSTTQAMDPAFLGKRAATDVGSEFSIANAIALSCGKRSSLAAGDSWRVASKADDRTYDVTVSGNQSYRGHDVVVLTAKTHKDDQNFSTTIEGAVYYDLAARQIIGAHTVTINHILATGVTTSVTSELNLKE
jgi:hypothetical protein